MAECHFCGNAIDPLEKVSIRDTCVRCHRDLHTCRNCRFHDPSAHNQCREPQAEQVGDREKANFCTYFSPGSPLKGLSREATAARKKLEDLFRKVP
ncbi:MAG: hypothetical protein WC889_18365 [Myxococcota bacterium]|jgi:hypothetical protein